MITSFTTFTTHNIECENFLLLLIAGRLCLLFGEFDKDFVVDRSNSLLYAIRQALTLVIDSMKNVINSLIMRLMILFRNNGALI
jgi:hypothetical protein